MFGFVILNYLNYLDTIELLDSIAAQEWSDSVYIYVVDNGSPNDSVIHLNGAISKSSLQIKFIESSTNLGFAKGENLGIRYARADGCEFIASVNNDVLISNLQDDFLTIFKKIYAADQSIAVITPTIYDSKGASQNPMALDPPKRFRIFLLKVFFLLRLNWLYFFFRIHVFFSIISKYVEWRNSRREQSKASNYKLNSGYIYAAHGSFQVFTPKYFKYFDGHDEQVFMYCEEYIKAEQLQLKGLKTWYEANVVVTHKTSMSVEMMSTSNKEKIKFLLLNMIKSCNVYVKMLKF
jgi:GT2 family glycosyltransferase